MKNLAKLFLVLCLLMIYCTTCSAMTFQPMEKLGRIYYLQVGAGGIALENATTNKGNYFTKHRKNNTHSYEKGVASFGYGASALYFYYNYNDRPRIKIGNKNGDKLYNGIDLGYDVNCIKTDSEITLYPLLFCYGPECFYNIYGIRGDGKCVEYINMGRLLIQYFGDKGSLSVICKDIICRGDTLVVPLSSYGNKGKKLGEFIFKWDEKAQWFSVTLNKY